MRGRKNITQTEAVSFITGLLTEMGWNDVTAEASSNSGIKFKRNNDVLINITLYYPEWELYYNNGNSSYKPEDGAERSESVYTIYGTAHGILIKSVAPETSNNMYILITKDDDNISIAVKGSFYEDYSTKIVVVTYADSTYQTISFSSNPAINTSLCNMVRVGEIGTDTVCKYAFFMPLYQYNSEGILTINDIQYASNGYWCLSDE